MVPVLTVDTLVIGVRQMGQILKSARITQLRQKTWPQLRARW
jgi:hypothetical protein